MRSSFLLVALIALACVPGGLFAGADPHLAINGLAAQLRGGGSYLGIRLLDIDSDRAKALKLPDERGVEVADVMEGSPAERSGLRKGDVLISYNGENILGAEQFVRLVQETPPGRKVKIQVWRDGKYEWLVVTTGTAKSWFTLPPNFVGFPGTKIDVFTSRTADIPSPMLIWKSSFFGIECESVEAQLAQYFGVKHGVLVRAVDKGSAADKAGLRAGDVIVALGDHAVSTPHDMSSYLRSEHQQGQSVAVSMVRDHKPLTLNVAPVENPQ
ncbi:MAG: PDZ domain-containing protein [Acidobacteriaceae bacterium]|nr:PDZ domain-containing protein [Acidobacteriaceae bacterium]